MARKNPDSLKEQNPAKITSEIRNFVNNLSSSIVDAKTERGFWETQIDKYINLRYGIRQTKVHPWPKCANYMMPLIDTDIARAKPSYVNLLNVSPIVSFEPYGAEDIEPARKREYLFDWRMKTKVDYFSPYVTGVDYLLMQGMTVFKNTWKYATRTYYKKIDLKEVPEEVLQALYDPRMDDPMLYRILVEEFQIDDSFDENKDEILRVIKEFREGASEFEMKMMECSDDRAEMTAVSVRDELVFPVDTCELNDARFIDYIFTRSQNDIKIAMKDGKYEEYTDGEILSWTSSNPRDNRRNNMKQTNNGNQKDDLVWLHETCVWYDIDGDGIEERCICTWPDAKPDMILRFIELPYDHGQWPYVLVKREFIGPGIFETRGYGALGEDFQNAITTFVNQSVDNGTITNTPRTKYKRGSIANIRNIRYVPGEALEVLTNLEDVKVESGGNSSQAFLFQSAQYFKAWSDQRTGNLTSGLSAPNNQTGMGVQGQKTAKEVGLVEQLQAEVQSLDLQVFQNQMAKVYYQIDALYEQFGNDEEEILITGEKPIKVSRREIQGKFNIVPNGKLDNSNPQLRAAKAFNLMRVFLNDPMINQRELKELYLMETDVRLVKTLLKSPEQLQQEAAQAAQQQEAVKREAIQTQLGLKLAGDNLEIRKSQLMKDKVSESMSFKDMPIDGQMQMAAQAGIFLHPEGLRQMKDDQKKADAAKAKNAFAGKK